MQRGGELTQWQLPDGRGFPFKGIGEAGRRRELRVCGGGEGRANKDVFGVNGWPCAGGVELERAA